MKRKAMSLPKKTVSFILASAMVVGSLGYAAPIRTEAAGAAQKEESTILFTPAPAGHVYAGMPLFDGNPDHYEQYLDAVIDYIGLEGSARFAFDTRYDYVLKEGKNAGKTIPGSLTFTDCVQGVSTDFPAIIGLGQSWNKDLVEEVGHVLGNERINKVDYSDLSNINVMACTATSDLRINPLSGRFDEGFAEDPYLAATMVNEMATGVSGINAEENKDGFWQKAVVTTKHFTTYNAQTLRTTTSNNASARTLMEYQPQSALKGFESGAVSGFMSSYGRTNGIPNIISPLINFAKSIAPYGLFSVTDAGSVSNQSSYGNGFDSGYVLAENQHGSNYSAIGAMMAVANSSGASTTRQGDESFWTLVEQVKAGTYGVTREDVERVARDQIGQLVRCGVLNENIEDYPFYDQSKGVGRTDDFNNTYNQEVALKAAQESIVLLKNDKNVLPLNKDASVYVSGPMSITRFKTTYAVSKSPEIENALYSSAAGIKAVADEDKVKYSADGQIVNIKASDGTYIALSQDGKSLVTVEDKEKAAKFEKYSWGQEGYTYKCLDNDKWLKGVTSGGGWGGGGTFNGIEASGTESLEQVAGELGATYITTTMPYRFRVEKNQDNTLTYVMESFSESFMGSGPTQGYYQNGRYMAVKDSGELSFTDKLTNVETAKALRTEAAKFTEEIVSDYGSETIASGSDYAVVVVGAPTRHSSGEGCDRSDLHLGEGQYEQVANVAKAYPGRTIVIVQTNYPEIIQEIKDNKNVAAILVQPYAGQYGGYALGQVVYGDVAPTGKLSATWYNTNDVLPGISEYSIAEGNSLTLENIDPRFTTDMTNADPAETGLTYMYTDTKDVTYAFGSGLTYSDFAFSNLSVPDSITSDTQSFSVSVDVTNTGKVGTSEVVQIYMANPDSAYGGYAPQTKLVAFEKVFVEAGRTKTVELIVDADDFAVWNTNGHKYTVEEGNYQVMAGSASDKILAQGNLVVAGEQIGILDASQPVSVFDSSFASSEVVYREVSKAHTAEALANASRDNKENAAANVASGYYAVMAKQDGSWVAMKNVDLNGVNAIKTNVASRNEYSAIEVRADSVDGELIGTIDFCITPVNSYTALENGDDPDAAIDLPVRELGYQDVVVDLDGELAGIHDVYLVFRNADARINTIQFEKAQRAKTDTTVLASLVEKISSLASGGYTQESFAKAAQALEAAKQVLNNSSASQEEINKAAASLVDALTGLKPAGTAAASADVTALAQAIQKAKEVKRSQYTKESLAHMDEALAIAEKMSSAGPGRELQGVVDVIAKSLNDAVNDLELKKGQRATAGRLTYKVTSSVQKTVSVVKPAKKTEKTIRIPTTVKISGRTYKVTAIEAKAFKNNKKLTTVKVGTNVRSIGKEAFAGCSRLKRITITSKKLTKVGSKALRGIYKKAVVKVPASKVKKYKTLFKSKGQKSSVTIKN